MGFNPDDAVLVIHAGGRPFGIGLRHVAEIRGVESVHAAGAPAPALG